MARGFSARGLFDIAGRTIVVTGGAVGIGKAYSKALGEVGANVVIADIEAEAGKELAATIDAAGNETGGHAIFVETDVSKIAACEAMAKAAIDRFGRIDGLINNAALYAKIPKRRNWEDTPEEEWDRLMAVNLKGIFNCCKAVHAQMKSQGYGKIVNISSSTWLTGTTGRLHYTTSKAGVVGFTRSISHDLGVEGITVNAVCPGLTKSETIGATMPESHWQAREKKMAGTAAIPRVQMHEDLDGTIIFLMSSASDFVTGQTIACEGGVNHL
jgi:3-oxoacyl-[acyl-carrier protein] reductase